MKAKPHSRHMTMTKLTAVGTLGLLITGCGALQKAWSGSGGSDGYKTIFETNPAYEALRNGGPELQRFASLLQPKSCAEAKEALITILSEQMKPAFESQVRTIEQNGGVSQADFETNSSRAPGSVVSAPWAKSTAAGAEGSRSDGPTDFTTTNNQTEGVEEGDFVKNSSGLIFLARGNKIEIVKSWPAADMAKLASLDLAAQPQEMLLVGSDRLVVAARPKFKGEAPKNENGKMACYQSEGMWLSTALTDFVPGVEPCSGSQYAYDLTNLIVIDVSSPSSPKIIDRKLIRGTFQSFRRVENSVRLVMAQNFAYPERIEPDLNYVNGVTSQNVRQKARETMNRNLATLRQLPLETLLDSAAGSTNPAQLEATESSVQKLDLEPTCGNIYTPQILSPNLSLSKIVTYDLNKGSVSQSIIPGFAGTVYASSKSIYLTSSASAGRWGGPAILPEGRALDYTFVHRFDISEPDQSSYLGSGFVEGTALNQFSLDEHADVLRIATTINISGSSNERRAPASVNRVTTMGLRDNRLRILGQTPDLAPGERIFSARFSGERGFIVTFRQVDPLFAIDLRDPSNPKVVGELKIPGFSSYMQFIAENTILTIGRDADINSGRTRDIKISVFDVSDMRNLREVASKVLDEGSWQSSEAQSDHKAFTYFAKSGHLAVPMQSSGYMNGQYTYQNELRLFHIDASIGVTDAGTVDTNEFTSYPIRRSIFADEVVYAISESGIKAAQVAQPQSEIAHVQFVP